MCYFIYCKYAIIYACVRAKVPYLICYKNNPLHISLFPAEGDKEGRNKLEFSFMLSTSLDIFEARMPSKTVGQDFGLLQAIDERLAMYGWLTNTGVKFVIVIDMEGRLSSLQDSKNPAVLGLKNSDLTPVRCVLAFSVYQPLTLGNRLSKPCKWHIFIC